LQTLPFDVEPKDLNAVVVLTVHSFFTGVELFAFIDVFSAGIAAHGERRHETDDLLLVLDSLAARNEGGIKVRREVFVEDFAFGHDELDYKSYRRWKEEVGKDEGDQVQAQAD
jgi:hypothetical protein